MCDKEYNGWTNRETWLVNLWYNPENKVDVEMAREDLERQLESIENGCLKDMISLDSVNWGELMCVFEEEEYEEEEEEEE